MRTLAACLLAFLAVPAAHAEDVTGLVRGIYYEASRGVLVDASMLRRPSATRWVDVELADKSRHLVQMPAQTERQHRRRGRACSSASRRRWRWRACSPSSRVTDVRPQSRLAGSGALEARTRQLQELDLLGRAGAPEDRVAVREAAEALDDLAVPLAHSAAARRRAARSSSQASVLVGERLAVLERQVGEERSSAASAVVAAASARRAASRASASVGEGARRRRGTCCAGTGRAPRPGRGTARRSIHAASRPAAASS